jgi:hypothetical protein
MAIPFLRHSRGNQLLRSHFLVFTVLLHPSPGHSPAPSRLRQPPSVLRNSIPIICVPYHGHLCTSPFIPLSRDVNSLGGDQQVFATAFAHCRDLFVFTWKPRLAIQRMSFQND